LYDFAQGACARLYDEDGSVCESLGKLEREAGHNARFDPDLEPVAKRLQTLADEVQDLANTLRTWTQSSEADPGRQEELESRVLLLRRLESKYGKTIDELVVYRQSLDAAETKLVGQEEDRQTLETRLAEAFAQVRQLGGRLSKERQKVAKTFVSRVQKELA